MVKLSPSGHTEDTTLEHRVVGFLCGTGASYGVDLQLPVSPKHQLSNFCLQVHQVNQLYAPPHKIHLLNPHRYSVVHNDPAEHQHV